MDLIYTDKNRNDVGVLKNYTLDLAFGADENDFELVLNTEDHCCTAGCLVYVEGTEYGGIIDRVKVITDSGDLYYMGRTWHGILGSKVIEPEAGKAYLTVSGEANQVLGVLLDRLGVSTLFVASPNDSGLMINNYSFDRYTDGYSGIMKMLATISAKLKVTFKDGVVILSAMPIVDYSKDEQFDNDQIAIDIEKNYSGINHLICLGKGELAERQVIHLYVDENGKVSGGKTFSGIEEVVGVHDYPNAESEDELRKSGVELLETQSNQQVKLDFTAEQAIYDIGDIIGTKETITGTQITEKITKKIITINHGDVNIEYKVGE